MWGFQASDSQRGSLYPSVGHESRVTTNSVVGHASLVLRAPSRKFSILIEEPPGRRTEFKGAETKLSIIHFDETSWVCFEDVRATFRNSPYLARLWAGYELREAILFMAFPGTWHAPSNVKGARHKSFPEICRSSL